MRLAEIAEPLGLIYAGAVEKHFHPLPVVFPRQQIGKLGKDLRFRVLVQGFAQPECAHVRGGRRALPLRCKCACEDDRPFSRLRAGGAEGGDHIGGRGVLAIKRPFRMGAQ